MKRQTIKTFHLKTLDWYNGKLVDWNSAGTIYSLDGNKEQLQKYHFGFVFDSSITSECGNYVLIYRKLGTKGLLLKNGEVLREINRSYYQSEVYEFPAAFFTRNAIVYLIHCPATYCKLDFEEVESGRIITSISSRNPWDFFHSRLEVSPDNKFLLSKGWFWHPFDCIKLFDIEACIFDPCLLDRGSEIPNVTAELSSASFIDNDNILVCASREEPLNDDEIEPILPGQIAIWNFKNDDIAVCGKVNAPIGNVFAIDLNTCWDLFEYPKIIDLKTGGIIQKMEEIKSGKQTSSIIHHLSDLPQIKYNPLTKQIAIAKDDLIEILTP